MASANKNRRSLAEEISFLLSQSNNFSVSFGIKRDRARQWLFLGVLLDLEENSVISYPKLLDSDRLKKLIAPSRRSYNVYHWVREFIKGFANDDGPLTDVIFSPGKADAKRARTQAFRLNDNCGRGARKYVRTFVRTNCPDLKENVERLSEIQCRRLFKEMWQYQTKGYLPLWENLTGGLSKAAADNGKHSADDLAQMLVRGTNWVVLFLFWQEHLLQGATSWDSIDINQKATDILRLVEPEETAACIRDFSKVKGYQILLKTKEKAQWRYGFNKQYEKPLVDYSTSIATVRTGLLQLVRGSLR